MAIQLVFWPVHSGSKGLQGCRVDRFTPHQAFLLLQQLCAFRMLLVWSVRLGAVQFETCGVAALQHVVAQDLIRDVFWCRFDWSAVLHGCGWRVVWCSATQFWACQTAGRLCCLCVMRLSADSLLHCDTVFCTGISSPVDQLHGNRQLCIFVSSQASALSLLLLADWPRLCGKVCCTTAAVAFSKCGLYTETWSIAVWITSSSVWLGDHAPEIPHFNFQCTAWFSNKQCVVSLNTH